MKTARTLLLSVLILTTVALAFTAGYATRWMTDVRQAHRGVLPPDNATGVPQSNDAAATMEVFWQAWDILQRDFYDAQPSGQARTYGAIQGLTEAYNDPYTRFIEPEPRQREKEDLSGVFGGIGAWLTQDDTGQMVVDPMPDRPAEKAGLLKGDILVVVGDTRLTPEMTVEQVIELIRGPVGEAVALSIRRAGQADLLGFSVVRERIENPSVTWRTLENTPTVGYIALSSFTERTPGELDRALDELKQQSITALVLDLRHNGGGLLDASIEVASRFLSDGVVLYERRNQGEEQVYDVRQARRAPDWPMAVLVDGATASASEIVAGALQDRGRAILIGDRTFGKGSVQLVYDLSDGSSVHVTVARWLTPNHHEINGIGLEPQHLAPHEDTRDAPLEEAVHLLLAP